MLKRDDVEKMLCGELGPVDDINGDYDSGMITDVLNKLLADCPAPSGESREHVFLPDSKDADCSCGWKAGVGARSRQFGPHDAWLEHEQQVREAKADALGHQHTDACWSWAINENGDKEEYLSCPLDDGTVRGWNARSNRGGSTAL